MFYKVAPLVVVASMVAVLPVDAQNRARSPKVDFVPRFPAATADNRPSALGPLYFSFATLQGLDVHSTTVAMSRGAVEANPLLKWTAGNPHDLTAFKMLSATGLIYAAEKMRKKNRKAAVLFMAAANVASVFVVHHNYRVASAKRKWPASLPATVRSHRSF